MDMRGLHAFVAITATLVVTLAAVSSTCAQQSVPSASGLLFDPTGLQHRPSNPALTPPTPTARQGAATTARAPQSVAPAPVNVSTAPSLSRSRVQESVSAPAPSLGRVPIENFSFGLENDTKFKADQFPDGRPIPGLESSRRPNDLPLFGLSVKVPTTDYQPAPSDYRPGGVGSPE